LWERGSGLTAGAVALPARGMTLSTADPLPLLTSPAPSPRLAVSRSRPPSWIADVAARVGGEPTPIGSAGMKAMAILLGEAGINVDCKPVLDLPQPGAHDVIGDRALGREPMRIAALGRAVLDGLAAGGVCGVVKHMPGHGRAGADSHFDLPVVDADAAALESDLAPFRALRDAPMAMTAHLLFTAWDSERPATLSPKVIGEVIRGAIGFDGLLISDDIAMEALRGPLPERASAAIGAGCDLVLHCSGVLAEAEAIAGALGPIGEAASARLERALAGIAGKTSAKDVAELIAKRDALLAYA
jgi:beta-N-acetylhexosaminidase